MQTITIKDGQRYPIKSEQVIDGCVVTGQAIRNDMAKYGVSEIQIEDRKDDRYYFINELQGAPYIEQTAKPAEMIAQMESGWAKDKAQRHLDDTDYLFTVDKYAQLTEERKAELVASREAARQVIREYVAAYPINNI